MDVYLKKHGAGFSSYSVKLNWKRTSRLVTIDFQVQKRDKGPWHSDPYFTNDWSKNWGLWNKDVVEAFLQLRSHPTDTKAPYLEIQVSPLNQPFALIITEPRKSFFPPQKLDFSTDSSTSDKVWTGKMTVELPAELKGDLLYGGFFSCLGHEPREFYALELNPEAQPDFHRPELFLPLDLP